MPERRGTGQGKGVPLPSPSPTLRAFCVPEIPFSLPLSRLPRRLYFKRNLLPVDVALQKKSLNEVGPIKKLPRTFAKGLHAVLICITYNLIFVDRLIFLLAY